MSLKNLYRILVLFLILKVLSPASISGQSSLPDINNTTIASKIFFEIDNASFFKNNEYKGDVVKGYTLTGAWVRPKLVLFLTDKFRFESGWHYLRYNGARKHAVSIPWISSQLNLGRNWKMIIGNLDYYGVHKLILPMWDPERYLTDRPESGLQFLHQSQNLFIDTWVNWEQYIEKDDPFQEQFTFGNSLNWNIYSGEKFKINFPFQALFFHHGGEIDSSPLHVQTFANFATGLKSKIRQKGYFTEFSLSFYALIFKDLKGNLGLPVKNSSGWYIDASANTQFGDIHFNYWKANDFFSIKGMKLLQSFSEKEDGLWISSRSLTGIIYSFDKKILDGLIAGVRAEGWLDLDAGDFSNSGFVYILLNKDFLLKKF